MKRIGLAVTVAVLLAACAMFTSPGRVVLYAQTLPTTVHAVWDAPAATDNIINYTLTLDSGQALTVPNVLDASCSCIRTALTVSSFGSHSVSVVANNLLLSGDPTSTQSSAPVTVAFTLAKAATVVNSKVVK
jgi:hypothetical protein